MTHVEDTQLPARPGDSRNGPSRTSGESFLAHPAHALLTASGMLALVVLIAILVPTGPLDVDRSWSDAMHHLQTPLLTDLALVLNWLGRGIGRAVGLTLVGLLLLRQRRWFALVVFAVAESLAPLFSTLLKALVDRARPPDGLVHPVGASFPSGHATYAGATCVALVLLFSTPGTRRRWWWMLASLGIVGMAWSRTYLQVHWLTDVIAGALLGTGVSLLVFAIAQRHVNLTTQPPLQPSDTGAPNSHGPHQTTTRLKSQTCAESSDQPHAVRATELQELQGVHADATKAHPGQAKTTGRYPACSGCSGSTAGRWNPNRAREH